MADGSTQQMGPQNGVPPAPPPPPPLPTGGAQRPRGPPPPRVHEPPACVQNAMMTKDKKPFTYTPGGLDLSQIKSPRMARRIERNALAEGAAGAPRPAAPPQFAPAPPQPNLNQVIPPPPPPPQSHVVPRAPPLIIPQQPPASQGNFSPTTPTMMQRDANPPPQPPTSQGNYSPGNFGPTSPPMMQRSANPPPQPPASQGNFSPGNFGPTSPTMMQRGANPPPFIPLPQQPQSPRSQVGSIYIPPLKQPQTPQTPQSPIPVGLTLNKAPTPWLTRNEQADAQGAQPAWSRGPVARVVPVQEYREPAWEDPRGTTSVGVARVVGRQEDARGAVTRIIPIQIEGREQQQPQQQRFVPAGGADSDRELMGRIRAQVDEESILHGGEIDPRYRGAAIPSRAFRMLQSMTGSGSDDDVAGRRAVQQQQPQPPRTQYHTIQTTMDACGPGQSDL